MSVFERRTLGNGLRVLTAPLDHAQSVACFVMLAAGSRYEHAENRGIAHFAEHMFFKGTERRPTSRDLTTIVDGIGGEFNAFTSKEYTGYYVRCAANDRDTALDVLLDMLRHSKFDPEEIEREKGVILEEMNMYVDTPRDHIGTVYETLVFGDNPLGWETLGTKETIRSATRDTFVNYVDEWYTPERMVVGVSGKVGEGLEPMLEELLGDMSANGERRPVPAEPHRDAGPHVSVYEKQADQAHLILGVPSYPIDHPDRYALQLLSTVLGGGMSSRLFTGVRERRGLAYYVHGLNHSYTDAGTLYAQAGVDITRIDEAVGTIAAELRKIAAEPIPAGELEKARAFAKGRFVLQLETPQGRMMFGLRREVLAKRLPEPSRVVAGRAPVPRDGVQVRSALHHDVSLPLRDLHGAPATGHPYPARPIPVSGSAGETTSSGTSSPAPALAVTSGLNFAGVGNGDYGFFPDAAPPDTNLAVGATQVVQWVNESFAVFDKATGALVAGPTRGNALWAGFGSGCETNNDGDPIVQYDKTAGRWIFTQFSVSTTPYLQCVAVSTTSDATGSYSRYSFSYGNTQFPDYPKLGVWPDAYYISFNIFNNGTTFGGAKVCAFDRNAMLAGAQATQQCFQLSTSFGGLLPSDLDGTTAPPAGSPNFFLFFGTNNLNLFKFHVDFATPANSTFTGPTAIPVTAFTPLCNGGTCVPQSGTTPQLHSLADRLMYRLAYRNFGSHESLVVNHAVVAGSTGGIRWYELQNPNGTVTVAQQSTLAPDSNFRWMRSIAMDKAGDMAMGYSVSSSAKNPSVAFTGRTATDPTNTIQAE